MKLLTKFSILLHPVLLLISVTGCAWLLRGTLTLANFTMIYILVVLVLAIRRGTWVAIVAALVSFLCINFFLVHPYYTFIVADPREVIDLIVFLIVATLVGQLAARARQQAYEAQQRAYEQEILYRLTRSFNQIATSAGVYEALINVLKTDLAARQAYVLPYGTGADTPDSTVHYLLLQTDASVYGTLCATFDTPYSAVQTRLLNTCTSQAAMALQRIELTERARKSEQFEEADRLKTALLHAVSHDLRTPITIIKTSASNLRTPGDNLSTEERRELSEVIENEADQLDKMIGNLLDMSRLRAGAMTLNSQANSLEEIAGDVAASIYQRIKQERIQLDFPEGLPLVAFDYGLMLQALSNLVDNALRYEQPDRQIILRGSIVEYEAYLAIINHGENMTADEREHLMEPFYHGRGGNIGLGLAIARGIVEAHHGQLRVEDTPGSGTTFIIALPLDREQVRV
ncbi:MAG: DUF4118 domain-containing protein [Anaerolineae bacterium]|nr:DUF4118 domain-containing protein [Anaerolineae bacterium]